MRLIDDLSVQSQLGDVDAQLKCFGFGKNRSFLISLLLVYLVHAHLFQIFYCTAAIRQKVIRHKDILITRLFFAVLSLYCFVLCCTVASNFAVKFFVLAFPSMCRTYYPPFTPACLQSAWLETGCLREGFLWPKTQQRMASIEAMVLR